MGIEGTETSEAKVNSFATAVYISEILGQLAGAVSVCWEHPEKAGVFHSERASEFVDEAFSRLVELEPLISAVLSDDETVIQFKGENYYKACSVRVTGTAEGAASHCTKRVGHPGVLHEDFHGNMRAQP